MQITPYRTNKKSYSPLIKAILATAGLLISSSSLAYSDAEPSTEKSNKAYAIAIHGGAGTISREKMTAEQETAYKDKLAQAVNRGYEVLEQGGSSQQAVIAAIQIMESSPYFNAGKGAVYTYEEEHELDASVMDGKTLNAGAVAGVKTVKSPIALAQAIMEKSVHVLLSGEGAETFAKQQQLEQVPNSYFDTEHRYQQLLKAKEKLKQKEQELKDFQAAHQSLPLEYKTGTVGAVALDKNGNLFAGTSTGGMTAKRYGRIGDSPVIGAGTWADNSSCAVSATGHGEYFIRYHVAADICARVKYQQIPLAQAADEVINKVLVEAGGSGGIIAIDAKGNIAMPFNSSGMYRASRRAGEPAKVNIFKK